MTRQLGRCLFWVAIAVGLIFGASVAIAASATWSLPSEAWADKGPAADGDELTHLSYCGALVNEQGDPGNTVHFAVYVEDGGAWPLVYQSGEYPAQASGCIEIALSVSLGAGGLIEASHEGGAGTFGLEPAGTLTLTYGAPAEPSPVVGMIAAVAGVYTSQLFGILGATIALVGIIVIPALVMRAGVRLALRALRRVFGAAS